MIGPLGHDAAGLAELGDLARRAEERPDAARESRHADAVGLVEDEVGHRGGGGAGEVVLRPRPRAVSHRLAGIDQEPGDEVRLLLVLLQVEPLGAAEDLPVDVLDVVAGRVLAVLGELDGEAVPRTAMAAGQVPLHDLPGFELQAVDPRQYGGVGNGRHANQPD